MIQVNNANAGVASLPTPAFGVEVPNGGANTTPNENEMADMDSKISSTYPRRSMMWKDIPVGALLYIQADENIPADCLILCSGNDDGSAFVETANSFNTDSAPMMVATPAGF